MKSSERYIFVYIFVEIELLAHVSKVSTIVQFTAYFKFLFQPSTSTEIERSTCYPSNKEVLHGLFLSRLSVSVKPDHRCFKAVSHIGARWVQTKLLKSGVPVCFQTSNKVFQIDLV